MGTLPEIAVADPEAGLPRAEVAAAGVGVAGAVAGVAVKAGAEVAVAAEEVGQTRDPGVDPEAEAEVTSERSGLGTGNPGAKVVLDPNLAVNPVIKTGLNLERKTGLNPVIKTGPNPVRKTRLNPVRKTDLNPLKNVAPNPSPRANPARRNGRDLAAAANPGEKTDLNPEASPNHEASLVIKVNQEAGLDPVTSDRIFN